MPLCLVGVVISVLFYIYRIKELEEEEEKSSKEEVKSIVSSIEHELHKYYGDTNSKYKARYRSLVFNIKDNKNKVGHSSHAGSTTGPPVLHILILSWENDLD